MKLSLRALAIALFVTAAIGAAGSPAAADHCRSRGNAGNNAANYSGGQSDIGATQSQGQPGDRVGVHGCGFNPSSNVTFDLNSTPMRLGSTTTDANGAFDVRLTIPSDAPVGRHTITATGVDPQGRAKVESVAFTVVTPAQAQNTGRAAEARTLPRTGTSTVPLVAGSTALVGLGVVLVIAARRRREASA